MLNRLREGNYTNEDIRKLKERVIMPTDSNYTKDAPHLCIQNTKMNEFDNSLSGTRYSFKEHDSVVEVDYRHAVRE